MSRQNNTTVQLLQTKKLQNGGGPSSAGNSSAAENQSVLENADNRARESDPDALEPPSLLRVGMLCVF